MIRRFETVGDSSIWAEYKQLPDLSFQCRDWTNENWWGVHFVSWNDIESWAEEHHLLENNTICYNLPPPLKCDCGGEKTSGPGCHSNWCQTLQKMQVGA